MDNRLVLGFTPRGVTPLQKLCGDMPWRCLGYYETAALAQGSGTVCGRMVMSVA